MWENELKEHSEDKIADPQKREGEGVEKASQSPLSSPRIVDTILNIPKSGVDAMQLMDAEDEKQIIKAELFDETVRALVYLARNGESTLTISGLFEAARRFKNIETGVTKIEKNEEGYLVFAYAKNLKDNIKVELAYDQPYKILVQGGMQKDQFALAKAQAKAIRNCVRKVIPANYFQAMIKLYINKRKEKKNEAVRF